MFQRPLFTDVGQIPHFFILILVISFYYQYLYKSNLHLALKVGNIAYKLEGVFYANLPSF